MKLRPLGNRVILKVVKSKEMTKSGLYIPSKALPQTGIVIAIGEGRCEKGKMIPVKVKIGDEVLFGRYSAVDIEFEGRDLLVVRDVDLIAVIEGS